MTTKKRSLIMSVLTLVLCLALFASGTYALFSDEVEIEHHLNAGTLDITLERIEIESEKLNTATGYLDGYKKDERNNPVNFSEPGTLGIFDIVEGTDVTKAADIPFVPLTSYTATMRIKNDKATSNVAFGYYLEIVFDDKTDLTLASQISVTVTSEKGTITKDLDEGLKVGGEGDYIGIVDLTDEGCADEFKVTILFENDTDNNSAKGKSVGFDLIVHAVQVTEDPNA